MVALRPEDDRAGTFLAVDAEPGEPEAVAGAAAVGQDEAELTARRNAQPGQQRFGQHGVRRAGVHSGPRRSQVAAVQVANADINLER